MSAHLQISAERLATLPDGVALADADRGRLGRPDTVCDNHVYLPDGRRLPEPLSLDLTDTVTAAVVASCLVWPWLSADRERRAAHRDVEHVVRAAERMQPLTTEQVDTLARLARAAMEAT